MLEVLVGRLESTSERPRDGTRGVKALEAVPNNVAEALSGQLGLLAPTYELGRGAIVVGGFKRVASPLCC